MKKLTLVLSVTIWAFVAMSVVAENAAAISENVAVVKLDPKEGFEEVDATMIFIDTNGGDIEVRGIAHGLDPTLPYASLAYASNNCFPPSLLPMTPVGFWDVKPNGIGKLSETLDDSFFLSDIGSVSVRRLDVFALVACGQPND